MMEPWIKQRITSVSGLLALSSEQQQLVLSGNQAARTAATNMLQRLSFHSQWGCAQRRVAALMQEPRRVTSMLVRLSAMSTRVPPFGGNLVPGAEKLRIGKDPAECHLAINLQDVSRKHCTLTREPERGKVHIQDFSTNGTFLNGRRLPSPPFSNPEEALVRLCHGDELTFRAPRGGLAVEDLGYIVNLIPKFRGSPDGGQEVES